MKTIAVVDYGMGNLRSVAKAVERVVDKQMHVVLTDDVKVIAAADRVIVPGQGAARGCMHALREHNLIEALLKAATEKPFLGICMGLQVLMTHSEENKGTGCLDVFDGEVHFFGNHAELQSSQYKLPHMGWNRVKQQRRHPLWRGISDGARFYFVHSYYVKPQDADVIVGTTDYGIEFTCAIARGNVFAVQFHPEKSADEGLKLLNNFVHWNGQS
ncbi:MAG: imidazole glycerol phosphate synthase subunit HisH [Gammaproteobacteria bacterium]|nr:imidazole glycerol phosphate synthase subunit HisH [Gammaproteobacteria bacterium]